MTKTRWCVECPLTRYGGTVATVWVDDEPFCTAHATAESCEAFRREYGICAREEVPAQKKADRRPSGRALYIYAAVADHFGMTVAEMCASQRTPRILRPRQIAMYLGRMVDGASYPTLGAMFGKHHTTVMSAVDRIARMRSADTGFDETLQTLEQRCGR